MGVVRLELVDGAAGANRAGGVAGPADWRSAAACLDEDPDLFFPDGDGVAAMNQLELARRVCLSCRVRRECLEFALADGAPHGMWGGQAPGERRAASSEVDQGGSGTA